MEIEKKLELTTEALREILKLTYPLCDHQDESISNFAIQVNKKAHETLVQLER